MSEEREPTGPEMPPAGSAEPSGHPADEGLPSQDWAPPEPPPPAAPRMPTQSPPPSSPAPQSRFEPSAGPAPPDRAAPPPNPSSYLPPPDRAAPPPNPSSYLPPPAPVAHSGRTGVRTGVAVGIAAVAALIGAGLALAFSGGSDDGVGVSSATSTTIESTSTTKAESGDGDQTPPLRAEQLAHSVVQIQLLLDGEPTCTGSGTIVDTEGMVVTNFHVVAQTPICPHDQIGVGIAASSQSIPELRYEADLFSFDSDLDLAVVKITGLLDGGAVTEEFEPIELGDSDTVQLGDRIRVIGYPGIGGQTVTFTTGSVSGFAQTPEGEERSWLKTDATITGGNSGGLAVDEQGRFIGIPTRAGSGSGQIVDCRVIADANGDGTLDDKDSCVPIGGFINGIRPVALAIPLIEAAKTAQPIDQGSPDRAVPMSGELPLASNPTWTSGLTELGEATDSLAAGVEGQGELCVTWDYENVPTGTLTDVVWVVNEETVPEASVFDDANEGDSTGSFFACIFNDAGLVAGIYELGWIIDEELIFAEAIIVNAGATALIDVENATDVDLCVVQFNPNATATYGLNELEDPIPPGGVATFVVGVGPLDARIIDCDGDIRLEDSSGFAVEDDLILTVD